MLRRLVRRPLNIVSPAAVAVAEFVVSVAAAAWRARAGLLDLAGVGCVAVFVELYLERGGFLVAGLWLMVTAFNVERRGRAR